MTKSGVGNDQFSKRYIGRFKGSIFDEEPKRAREFRRFLRAAGSSLYQFALFQALQDHFQGIELQRWPIEFRHPTSPEVKHFAAQHHDRLEFYQYVEWQCELQLRELAAIADQKMDYGLYNDLAVGIHPNGADAWMFSRSINRRGDDWSASGLFQSIGPGLGFASFTSSRGLVYSNTDFFVKRCVRQ